MMLPSLENFSSYEALGRSYRRRDYFRALGVSFFRTRQRAAAVGARFGHARAIVVADVRREGVVWAETGGHQHITVWAPPEVLLACVVQCLDDEL